jgi:hypothetical protein
MFFILGFSGSIHSEIVEVGLAGCGKKQIPL